MLRNSVGLLLLVLASYWTYLYLHVESVSISQISDPFCEFKLYDLTLQHKAIEVDPGWMLATVNNLQHPRIAAQFIEQYNRDRGLTAIARFEVEDCQVCVTGTQAFKSSDWTASSVCLSSAQGSTQESELDSSTFYRFYPTDDDTASGVVDRLDIDAKFSSVSGVKCKASQPAIYARCCEYGMYSVEESLNTWTIASISHLTSDSWRLLFFNSYNRNAGFRCLAQWVSGNCCYFTSSAIAIHFTFATTNVQPTRTTTSYECNPSLGYTAGAMYHFWLASFSTYLPTLNSSHIFIEEPGSGCNLFQNPAIYFRCALEPDTNSPTRSPSDEPTRSPSTAMPTMMTRSPSLHPTADPATAHPTAYPTAIPTTQSHPSTPPTTNPNTHDTHPPTLNPLTQNPSADNANNASNHTSVQPQQPFSPTVHPTEQPIQSQVSPGPPNTADPPTIDGKASANPNSNSNANANSNASSSKTIFSSSLMLYLVAIIGSLFVCIICISLIGCLFYRKINRNKSHLKDTNNNNNNNKHNTRHIPVQSTSGKSDGYTFTVPRNHQQFMSTHGHGHGHGHQHSMMSAQMMAHPSQARQRIQLQNMNVRMGDIQIPVSMNRVLSFSDVMSGEGIQQIQIQPTNSGHHQNSKKSTDNKNLLVSSSATSATATALPLVITPSPSPTPRTDNGSHGVAAHNITPGYHSSEHAAEEAEDYRARAEISEDHGSINSMYETDVVAEIVTPNETPMHD